MITSLENVYFFFKENFFQASCEFNFWITLISFLQVFSLENECLLAFFGFFGILLVFFNASWKILKSLSQRSLFCIGVSSYIFLISAFFPILVFLLPAIAGRFSISAFIFLFSLILISLFWFLPSNQNKRFSEFWQQVLPSLLFLYFISSLSFSIYFFLGFELIIWFLVFLVINHKEVWKIFKEEWTPMILRSSFIFNFFRFFLPFSLFSDVFSFFFGAAYIIAPSFVSLEGVIFGPTRRYVTFTQQIPISSRKASTLINNIPPWLKSSEAPASRNIFNHSGGTDPEIKNFVQIILPEIFSYPFENHNFKASPLVEDSLKKIAVFSKIHTHKRSTLMPLHEIVAYTIALKNWPEATAVLPMSLCFPFTENALALSPIETTAYEDIEQILQRFKKYGQPFYFFFKGSWYLGVEDDYQRLTSKAATAALGVMTQDPNFAVRRTEFGKVIGALISSNDFMVLQDDKILSIQAKNRFSGAGIHEKVVYTSQDLSLLTNIRESQVVLVEHQKPQGFIIESKQLSIKNLEETCKHDPKAVIESLSKAEDFARSPSRVKALKWSVSHKISSSPIALHPDKGSRLEITIPISKNLLKNE